MSILALKRGAMAALAFALATLVALGPTFAQSQFLEPFDGAPATPQTYSNPHNWDIFVQGFDQREVGSAVQVGQHGPNCEAPGFPYTTSNTHPLRGIADTVYVCNDHVMTAPGLTGYGAIYMTPPAVADFSSGSTTVSWDMSTLRTSARDWVDVVLTPLGQHSDMAYNNNDQHIPPNNIHVTLAGTNVWLAYERINGGQQFGQGQDVQIQGDGATTWNQVFQAHQLDSSASRRDQFQITLTRTTISVCMPGYSYQSQAQFCWLRNAQLAQPLDPNVWHDQASVMFSHRVYNAEKACGVTTEDQFNIDHTAYGDANCPPDTWHWDNVKIQPFVPFKVIQTTTPFFSTHSTSPTRVDFKEAAPAGSHLSFVSFGHTPDLRVSYNGGSTWTAPHVQPANAPSNGASEENGEQLYDPIPAGTSSVMVRGSNGFWGGFSAEGFVILGPAQAGASGATVTPTSTSTASPTATGTSTAAPTSTSTVTPTAAATTPATPTTVIVPTSTATGLPADTPVPTAAPTNTPAPVATDTPQPTPTPTVEPVLPEGVCSARISIKDGALNIEPTPCPVP